MTPGSAVRHISAARYVTDCAMLPVILFEGQHDKSSEMVCVPSKTLAQLGHLPSLISLCCSHEASQLH